MPNRRNAVYVLIIVSLLAGLGTGRALFFNMAYLFAALLVLSFLWSWLAVRGVRIGRSTRTRRSQVGREFGEQFTVRNQSLLPKLWLEIRDHSGLPDYRASAVTPPMWPRARHRWAAQTVCRVRGEFQLGPMTVISGDPFGLFLSPRRINATERVIVYPAIVPLHRFHLPMGQLSGGEAERRFTHHITTNAAGVRDYIQGDAMNRVHWRSTARKGHLMVKEFELDPMVDIWLFVDFSARSLVEDPTLQRVGRAGHLIATSQDLPPSTEEYSVTIAASLSQHFIENERALGFAAYLPHREIHQPERGNRQLTRILQMLAVARSTSERSLREMLSLETPYFTRGTSLIIVTASCDTRWVAEAQILSSKGIRPMCVFVDPASFITPAVERSELAVASEELRGALQMARIPSLVIRRGDELSAALTQRPIL